MNEERKSPGEAAGDGGALHGRKTEVSWDGGAGRQPYSNQGAEEQGPGSAKPAEAGDRGDASGRNLDQLDAVKRKPEPPVTESRRQVD